ncbi:MAG TPA: MBL fold metallo-hydrolase [Chloroflexota bacterium]
MSPYYLEELARGVYARIGTGPVQPNSAFIVGDGGVTLFDTTYSPAAARAIAADIARVTAKPVDTLIISHHHWDHSWGAQVFSVARVIGHANTRRSLQQFGAAAQETLRQRAEFAADWMCVPSDQFAAEIEEVHITAPSLTFEDGLTMWLGEREVRLLHPGPAHTSGDVLLHLPAEGVVFGGDVVCNRLIPVVGDGDPAGFGEALQAVMALQPKAIVPGHGGVAGMPELERFAACLGALRAEVEAAWRQGAADPEEALKRVRLADFADWAGRAFLPGSVRRIWAQLTDDRPG